MSLPANDLVALLQQLIRIPSPNPPGDCRAVAEFCAAFLRNAGFVTTLVAPDDRAWSVVGVLGERDTPSLLYHAHIDTVPLGQNAQWSVDPFAGAVADGRVYGLGSVDDKAPLAAMLQAAAALGAQVEKLRGRLVVVCAAEEEVGGRLGTKWLVDAGHVPACDFVVVGEQTHNRVATAHKGVLRAAFHVAGRTSHATDPWRGRNAINGMAHLILDLERYQTEVLERRPHPLLGPASINVGVIEGGVSANVVADACTIRVDRRMVPGEDPQAVMAELQETCRTAPGRRSGTHLPCGQFSGQQLVSERRRQRTAPAFPADELGGDWITGRARRLSARQRRQAPGRCGQGRDGCLWARHLPGRPLDG